MALFSNVLLTVDFDRTLTAPDGTIPQRNLDAIRFFMEEGGAFTVNTGRSLPMARLFMDRVPVNAPLLLYNGAAAYEPKTGAFPFLHPITLPQKETLCRFAELCPRGTVEVQGIDAHYTFAHNEPWENVYDAIGCAWGISPPDGDMGPFLKASICCIEGEALNALFEGTPELNHVFDEYEIILRNEFPQLSVDRSTPVILDMQTAGVSKGTAARELARSMGRTTLVCVGDERNDITMLDMADFSFCPSDGKLAPYYNNVCPCTQGAVADVIYKKIPEILGFSLDKP